MGTPAVRRLLCTLVVAAAAMAQSASASMLMILAIVANVFFQRARKS